MIDYFKTLWRKAGWWKWLLLPIAIIFIILMIPLKVFKLDITPDTTNSDIDTALHTEDTKKNIKRTTDEIKKINTKENNVEKSASERHKEIDNHNDIDFFLDK